MTNEQYLEETRGSSSVENFNDIEYLEALEFIDVEKDEKELVEDALFRR